MASCPRCGKQWLKIEGTRLVCRCGYIREVTRTPQDQLMDAFLFAKQVVTELEIVCDNAKKVRDYLQKEIIKTTK